MESFEFLFYNIIQRVLRTTWIVSLPEIIFSNFQNVQLQLYPSLSKIQNLQSTPPSQNLDICAPYPLSPEPTKYVIQCLKNWKFQNIPDHYRTPKYLEKSMQYITNNKYQCKQNWPYCYSVKALKFAPNTRVIDKNSLRVQ